MSCGLAIASMLLLTNPDVALAAARPAAAADAPGSVAAEPLFADLVVRSGSLKAMVDAWAADGVADQTGFITGDVFSGFKARAAELADLDMQGHIILRDRGTDGDLKCILRGIAEDIPRKVAALEAATTAPARADALSDLAYLLNDNVEVITAPPQPEA